MTCRLTLCRVLILGAALFTVFPRSVRAEDPTALSSIVGSYVGFNQAAPPTTEPIGQSALLLLASGPERRFTTAGTLAMGDGSVRFVGAGSLSAANVVNIEGKTADGLFIVTWHGKVMAMGDGSVRGLAVRYHISDQTGVVDVQGFAFLIQRAGGVDWADLAVPAVQGCWDGNWASGITDGTTGPAELMVNNQMGSAFDGTLELDTLSAAGAPTPMLLGNFQGTITVPAVQDGVSRKLVIAADNTRGIIAILIGLLLPAVQTPGIASSPPQMEGTYMLFHNLGEVFQGVWTGMDTSFDHGQYSLLLPAVQ